MLLTLVSCQGTNLFPTTIRRNATSGVPHNKNNPISSLLSDWSEETDNPPPLKKEKEKKYLGTKCPHGSRHLINSPFTICLKYWLALQINDDYIWQHSKCGQKLTVSRTAASTETGAVSCSIINRELVCFNIRQPEARQASRWLR